MRKSFKLGLAGAAVWAACCLGSAVPAHAEQVDFTVNLQFFNEFPETYTFNFHGECEAFFLTDGALGCSFCQPVSVTLPPTGPPGLVPPTTTSFGFSECLGGFTPFWETCLCSTQAPGFGPVCPVFSSPVFFTLTPGGPVQTSPNGIFQVFNPDPVFALGTLSLGAAPEIDPAASAVPAAFAVGLLLVLADRRRTTKL